MAILAHSSKDIVPIASGPVALGLLVFMHALARSGASAATIAAVMAAYGVVFFFQVYAYHFHAHTPYFRSGFLNRTLDVVYSVINGEPHSFYTYQHLRHHDPLVLSNDTKYSRYGALRGALHSMGVITVLFYLQNLDCFRLYWSVALWRGIHRGKRPPAPREASAHPRRKRYSWHRKRNEAVDLGDGPTSPLLPPMVIEWATLGRERGYLSLVVTEVVAVAGVRIALAILAPKFFFLVYLPFSLILFAVRGYTDFVDHFGADVLDRSRNSVSCYGALFNLATFNSGYHLEHHSAPAVHWTKYPEIRSRMAPPSERRVIPGHLWLNPFFPLRPLTAPGAAHDEDVPRQAP